MLVLLAAAFAFLLAGGLSSAAAQRPSGPVQFGARVFAWLVGGEYGRVYDVLYPAQQKVISRARYLRCSTTVARLERQYFKVDFKTARLLKTSVPPKPLTAEVSGTHRFAHAILIEWFVSIVARGKRTTAFAIDGDVDHYVALVGGRWRYIDLLVSNYLKPHCGFETPQPVGSELLAKVPSWARTEGFSNNATALAGARLFAQSGCLNCHTYLGTGSHNLGAPDLSAEGAKHKGIAFQINHLKCPACVNPGSPMPSFAGIGDANLRKLAVFLEASKGRH